SSARCGSQLCASPLDAGKRSSERFPSCSDESGPSRRGRMVPTNYGLPVHDDEGLFPSGPEPHVPIPRRTCRLLAVLASDACISVPRVADEEFTGMLTSRGLIRACSTLLCRPSVFCDLQ